MTTNTETTTWTVQDAFGNVTSAYSTEAKARSVATSIGGLYHGPFTITGEGQDGYCARCDGECTIPGPTS